MSSHDARLPDTLADRARELLARHPDGRVILGIAGAPGSGKSTLAALLAGAIGKNAIVLPMDGFHLANVSLRQLGIADRKGAPDTFDAAGFAALLHRVRHESTATVYAPEFRREIEEPIAGAVAIGPGHRLVVVEGNYLLLDGPWSVVRGMLHESWFLDVPEDLRDGRLHARHVRFGRTPDAARAWMEHTDMPNARLIQAASGRADLIVRWTDR
ncbi:nucleoside/nucleotide kinase family protein [Rhizosaccharibacter radicis]|uniref:Nucleoside/nucleotide kinase family protein n=1 Tax=Rhizosaccharibacter radicis TaxID=2782605 RepID=A0ABT1VWX0_9PROT|nr:nucleoside/nucleotide kinase family protein [Acetobacteraceae bacterium KSS12]